MTVEKTTCQSSKLEEPATIYFNPATTLLKVFPTQQSSNLHVSLTENKACNVKVYEMRNVKFTCSSESHSPGGWLRP
jgi:hypothetical protein